MATWGEFAASAPEIAREGQRLLRRGVIDEALLATVRGDEPPRIHPIYLRIVGGRLYAFILRSAKRTDLERDGRYALHAHQNPAAPDEFEVRGRALLVPTGETRDAVAGEWWFSVDDAYELFEFGIESALLGRRPTADDWPPRYWTWRSTPGA